MPARPSRLRSLPIAHLPIAGLPIAGLPIAALLIAGLLLVGCDSGGDGKSESSGAAETASPSSSSSSSPAGAGPAAPEGAPAGPACTVATAALVGGKLGFTLAAPNVDRGPTATVCTFDSPSDRSQSATIQVQTRATAESFAKGREGFATHGEPVAAVAGLGDEAYTATLTVAKSTNTTLVARKGTIEVLITTTAPADRLRSLMTALLPLV